MSVVNVYTPPQAYTLPVVVSILKKNGLPKLLSALPESKRGRCIVTLAVSLASIANLLLNEELTGVRSNREQENFLDADRKFRELSEAIGKIRAEREVCLNRITFLERLREGIEIKPIRAKGEKLLLFSPNPGHPDSLRAADEAAWLISYKEASNRYDRLGKNLARAEKRLEKRREALIKKKTESREEPFGVDYAQSFREKNALTEVSPIANLIKYEFKWWGQFVALLSRTINTTLEKHPYKILLRDPHVLQSCRENEYKYRYKFTQSATWGYVVSNLAEYDLTANYNVSEKPSDVLVRKWKQRLEEEDRKTEEWITQTGGADNPFNIYNSMNQKYPDYFWVASSEIPLRDKDSREVQGSKLEELKRRRTLQAKVLAKIPVRQLKALHRKEHFLNELFKALGGRIDHKYVKLFPVTQPKAVRHGNALSD